MQFPLTLNARRQAITAMCAFAAAGVCAPTAFSASLPTGGFSTHTIFVTITSATTTTVTGTVDPGGKTTYYDAVYDLSSSTWCSSNGTSGKPSDASAPQLLRYIDFYLHAVVVNLTGLIPGTKYCGAISASNATGSATGTLIRFTAGAPDARTYNVTSTSGSTATVFGGVNPASQPTSYKALYDLASSTWCTSNGRSGTPKYSTAPQTLAYTDGTLHSVWVPLTGVSSETSYCVQITATNSSTTASGPLASFTLNVPGVINCNVSATGTTTATDNGAVNALAQSTYYGAVYDLATSGWCASGGSTPDATTTHDVGIPFAYADSVLHPVSVSLTALNAGTSYCVTIEASNPSGGSTQDVPMYFTTGS